jgi:ribosomal protein S19E (S16A)
MLIGRLDASVSVKVVVVELFEFVKTSASPDATGPEPPLEYVQFAAVAKSVLPAEPRHVSVSAKAWGLKPKRAKRASTAAEERRAKSDRGEHARGAA